MAFGLESGMKSVETCHRYRPNAAAPLPSVCLACQFLTPNRFVRCQPASEFELKITRHPGTLNEVPSEGEVAIWPFRVRRYAKLATCDLWAPHVRFRRSGTTC